MNRAHQSFCIAGIDPGISGAISFYYPEFPDLIVAEDIPCADKNIDISTLAFWLKQMTPDVVFIESVHSMPGQGVSSTFKFGTAYGDVRGCVGALGIPTHYASPQKWKRHFSLSADKEEARALALRYWPSSTSFARKKDHGRAEAALLARYASTIITVTPMEPF